MVHSPFILYIKLYPLCSFALSTDWQELIQLSLSWIQGEITVLDSITQLYSAQQLIPTKYFVVAEKVAESWLIEILPFSKALVLYMKTWVE